MSSGCFIKNKRRNLEIFPSECSCHQTGVQLHSNPSPCSCSMMPFEEKDYGHKWLKDFVWRWACVCEGVTSPTSCPCEQARAEVMEREIRIIYVDSEYFMLSSTQPTGDRRAPIPHLWGGQQGLQPPRATSPQAKGKSGPLCRWSCATAFASPDVRPPCH